MLLIEGCIIIVGVLLPSCCVVVWCGLFVLCTKHCLILQLSWCRDVFFAAGHNYINLLVVLSHV